MTNRPTPAALLCACCLALACAGQKATLPQTIGTRMHDDLAAKEAMYQELTSGGIDTAAAPYDALAGYLREMRTAAAGTVPDNALLQTSEKYIALSEKVDAFIRDHGITRLDIRAAEKQIYSFLHSTAGSIDEMEKGIRENRQRMYDSGAGDESETGQTLAALDKLKQSISVKTENIKKIIDTINLQSKGMKSVWIGPGTALGNAMDDIAKLTDELNGLSAQAHGLQKQLVPGK